MNLLHRILIVAASGLIVTSAGLPADAEPNRVTFPPDLDHMVDYTTVRRGNVVERMLTSRAAIDAIKSGQPIPGGTYFVLVDSRDGVLHRYFVMQKNAGWGSDYDSGRRTGDWQFQWFKPDKTINLNENTARCQSCHRGQASSDFLYTHDAARSFP